MRVIEEGKLCDQQVVESCMRLCQRESFTFSFEK